MTGGATELSLTGMQSYWLHYSATKGFFDSRHIPYEDFAVESIVLHSQGAAEFGRTAKFRFINSAELIKGGYIEATLPPLTAPANTTVAGVTLTYFVGWVHAIGFYMFEKIEFQVNSTTIDTHYPEFLDMWSRLTVPCGKREGYNDMIGEVNMVSRYGHGHHGYIAQVDTDALQLFGATKPQTVLTIPLEFWWCKSYAHALPIGILLFCEIYLICQIRAASSLYIIYSQDITGGNQGDYGYPTNVSITTPSLAELVLYVDYVFLDQSARNRLADQGHFYVIKHIKHNGASTVSATNFSYRLPFVMPLAELLFGVRETAATTAKQYHIWDRYTGNDGDINDENVPFNVPDQVISTALLKIMTDERFTVRGPQYWSRYQPYCHHTNIPSSKGIWMFNFGLDVESAFATGDCNFSTSDNNYLNLTFNQATGKDGTTPSGIGIAGITGELYVFAVTYNYIYVNNGYLTLIYAA